MSFWLTFEQASPVGAAIPVTFTVVLKLGRIETVKQHHGELLGEGTLLENVLCRKYSIDFLTSSFPWVEQYSFRLPLGRGISPGVYCFVSGSLAGWR